jgi:hypothetical protein
MSSNPNPNPNPPGTPGNPFPPGPKNPEPPQPTVVKVPVPDGQVDLLDPAVIEKEIERGNAENEAEYGKA